MTESSIRTDVERLALPHGRRVGQPGHEEAKSFLLGRMQEIGLVPFAGQSLELPFARPHPETREPTEFTNLIGVIKGKDSQKAPILVGAHYDSVIDAPCADDNATAVAVALAVAERFASPEEKLDRNLVIAIFDSEEPPFFYTSAMGSTRFYEDHCSETDFACVIIMDLIGHDVEINDPNLKRILPDLSDLLFVLGAESGEALPDAVETAASKRDGLRILATLNKYVTGSTDGDMSDHHAFRLGGEPFLFLTCGMGCHYHLPEDTVDWVNFSKVHRVYNLVAQLVLAVDWARMDRSSSPADTVEFEARMIARAFGESLPLLLRFLGLTELRTRSDIDRLAIGLKNALVI